MTPEQLRKIDALVQSKIMDRPICKCTDDQWKKYKADWVYKNVTTSLISPLVRSCPVLRYSCPDNRCAMCSCFKLEPYSTDIAAAWTVVERLNVDGWNVCVASRNDGKYACFVTKQPADNGEASYQESAPLSISLAALKAYGVDVNQELA